MLRTDLFKTVERAETRFIAIRDTLTKPDPKIDVQVMDTLHCKRGSLGIGYHFLILMGGDIQLGRDIERTGSHSKDYDNISVGVGIVGGTDDAGDRAYTRNDEQNAALSDLVAFLSLRYPQAEVHDKPSEAITATP